MRSTYVTTKRKQLMQVELSGVANLVGITSNTSFPQPSTFGGGTTPLPIIYFVLLYGDYICHFSPGLPSGSLVVPKLWTFISFSNHIYFENTRAMSYNPQKYLSNDV